MRARVRVSVGVRVRVGVSNVAHRLVPPRVDHVGHVGDGDRRLSHVGGDNHLVQGEG